LGAYHGGHLLEPLQEREQLLELPAREIQPGHLVAGFHTLWVGHPVRQMHAVVGDRERRERAAGLEMGEVGADSPARGRAANGVAARALSREEHSPSGLALSARR